MSYEEEDNHPINTCECGDVWTKWQFLHLKKEVKIRPKTIDCIFISYAHNSIVYRFLVHKSNILNFHRNTIIESMNASFFEDAFSCKFKEEPSLSKRVLETINENS